MLGFRLRSPLLRRGTVPGPPSNGFSSISLRRASVLILLGQRLRVFDALSLIYSISCYHGFGDTYMGTLPITYCLENIKIP
jgi:hypothetical protein